MKLQRWFVIINQNRPTLGITDENLQRTRHAFIHTSTIALCSLVSEMNASQNQCEYLMQSLGIMYKQSRYIDSFNK